MEIIIGREEGARRLHCIAGGREFNLGVAGSVPTSVSRKHCKLIINGDRLSIENLKDLNVTFVDGNQVFSKVITANSHVQLGNEKYPLPLKQILSLVGVGKPSSTPPPQKKEVPSFSLAPLEFIWDNYNNRLNTIQENHEKEIDKQKKANILRFFLMGVGGLAAIIPEIRIFSIIGMLLIAAWLAYDYMDAKGKDSKRKQLNALEEELKQKYICPNPKCGRPFGKRPYDQLKFDYKRCPYCGCEYTTD